MSEAAHIRILIAALGGEGGGVLATWLADAAIAAGFTAQRTSVPGVAQRTGATTYYIELLNTDGRRPALALSPAPGEVDLLISSELVETARMIQSGFVTPDRTHVIGATHRVYTINERIAMSDGRFNSDEIIAAAQRFAKSSALDDFAAMAQAKGCLLNAVLLGLAARVLPIAPEYFRAAISADGRAVEANLRGFDAGLAYAAPAPAEPPKPAPELFVAQAFAADVKALPEPARAFAAEGVNRLIDFQNEAHARTYIERIRRFIGKPGSDDGFLRELARHLAVRMSSEDTVRVAQLKLRDTRLARVNAEAKARPGDIVHVTEYFKPGPDELLSALPAWLASPLLGFVERRGWSKAAIPLRIRTTGAAGFLSLKLLASLRALRPSSLRAQRENAWIEQWLGLIERTLAVDPAAARELVESAKLVRGYGDTWSRGLANWSRIAGEVVEPMLAGQLPRQHFADAITQARIAALADPDGKRLGEVIASLKALPYPEAMAAQ